MSTNFIHLRAQPFEGQVWKTGKDPDHRFTSFDAAFHYLLRCFQSNCCTGGKWSHSSPAGDQTWTICWLLASWPTFKKNLHWPSNFSGKVAKERSKGQQLWVDCSPVNCTVCINHFRHFSLTMAAGLVQKCTVLLRTNHVFTTDEPPQSHF